MIHQPSSSQNHRGDRDEKLKTMTELLAVNDEYIEASEA
jgi:hypothetical protein